jgi:hypothetical protein
MEALASVPSIRTAVLPLGKLSDFESEVAGSKNHASAPLNARAKLRVSFASAPDQPPQNPICEKTTLTKKYQQAKATVNDIQPITPAYNSFIHDCSDVGMTPS